MRKHSTHKTVSQNIVNIKELRVIGHGRKYLKFGSKLSCIDEIILQQILRSPCCASIDYANAASVILLNIFSLSLEKHFSMVA